MPLAERTWRLRRALREAEDLCRGDRLVDYGVRLHVVRQDPRGADVIPGLEPVVSLRVQDYGGVYDTRARCWVGPSRQPTIWYASEEQAALLDVERVLVYGAMGAGKTRVLSMWLVLRAIELLGQGVELGATAPTLERLGVLTETLADLMPCAWYTYRARERLYVLRGGVRIRMISTTPRSQAVGSPVQGWNWAAAASEEIQDSTAANADIEARGRRAPGGVYQRFAGATAKDSREWRQFRDQLLKSGHWRVEHLPGQSNPFVSSVYWQRLRDEYDDRTYRRIVLAQDVGPERATYPSYDPHETLRPLPEVGARDATRSHVGEAMLIGHDPGTLQDVSLYLRCYHVHGDDCWWVVDETTTPQSTTEEHVLTVKERLQQRWELQWPGDDEPRALVRCDPQGDSDNRTDRSVYTAWRYEGFRILSAAYTPKGKPQGRVPKEAGIEMVNRLLCSASGKRRLFIDVDADGKPMAPRLAEALELSERDELGRAEVKVKGKPDLSHWPAALRYALWPYERLVAARRDVARGVG